jgi:hypothetical protein
MGEQQLGGTTALVGDCEPKSAYGGNGLSDELWTTRKEWGFVS